MHIDADADHAAGLSPRLRVVVDNPNPHHISILFKHFIVIDISECHLYYYETGRVMRRIDVVLGKPSTPTPRGQWAVYTKSAHPGGPFGGLRDVLLPRLRHPRHQRAVAAVALAAQLLARLLPLSNANITWLCPQCPIGTPVCNVY